VIALKRIGNPAASCPYDVVPLKESICQTGGNGVVSWFRGQGNVYTDILDDEAEVLEIKGVHGYHASSIINGLSVPQMEEVGLPKMAEQDKNVTIDQCIDFSRKFAMET
jgi:uncharacterized protein YaaW (UPF0174 family)